MGTSAAAGGRSRLLAALFLLCTLGWGSSGCGDDGADEVRGDLLARRGIVEGFYGPPYSQAQRLDMIEFMGEVGLNYYLYAPKLDPLHRDRWREPYPAEDLARFGDLIEAGRVRGVTINYALAPGLSFDGSPEDFAAVATKIEALFDVGFRDFCLLFDDITDDAAGADPAVQAALVIEVRRLLRSRDPSTFLCFISNFYNGTAAELEKGTSPFQEFFTLPSSAYYEAYRAIPADVPILWTGRRVFADRLRVADARELRAFAARPVIVWDNYPVNDIVLANELFLGPYQRRDAGLGSVLEGILLNPMLQPEATKIPLYTAARFFAEGEGYHPRAAWADAIERASGGSGAAALRLVAEQFQSHPLIGDGPESPELTAAVEDFLASPEGKAGERLAELLSEFKALPGRLESELGNPALATELAEPARKLGLLGEAGLLALDLFARREAGEGPAELAEDIGRLQEKLAEAQSIPWQVAADFAPSFYESFAERPPRTSDVLGSFFDFVLQALE